MERELGELVHNWPPPVLKRLWLWTLVCGFAAGPSTLFALDGFDVRAIMCGIVLFIALYTAISGTDWFGRFLQKPFVKRTLCIGFGTRAVLSTVLFPIGIFIDVIIGMTSIEIVGADTATDVGFAQTLAITLIDATMMNIALFAYMAFIYLIMRIFLKAPIRDGFCVRCGYDLRASPVRCPECGEPVRNNPLCERLQESMEQRSM